VTEWLPLVVLQAFAAGHTPEAYSNMFEGWQVGGGVGSIQPPAASGIQSTFLQPTPGGGEMHFAPRWPASHQRNSLDSSVPCNGGRPSIDVQLRPTQEAFAQVRTGPESRRV